MNMKNSKTNRPLMPHRVILNHVFNFFKMLKTFLHLKQCSQNSKGMICDVLFLYASDSEQIKDDLIKQLRGVPAHCLCIDDPEFPWNQTLENLTQIKLQVVFFSPGFLDFLECRPDEAYECFFKMDPQATVSLFCCGLRMCQISFCHMHLLKGYRSWPKYEHKIGQEGNAFPQHFMSLFKEFFPVPNRTPRSVTVVPQLINKECNTVYVIFSTALKNAGEISVYLESDSRIQIAPENVNPNMLYFNVPDSLMETCQSFEVKIKQSGTVLAQKVLSVVPDNAIDVKTPRQESREEKNAAEVVIADISGQNNKDAQKGVHATPSPEADIATLRELYQKYGVPNHLNPSTNEASTPREEQRASGSNSDCTEDQDFKPKHSVMPEVLARVRNFCERMSIDDTYEHLMPRRSLSLPSVSSPGVFGNEESHYLTMFGPSKLKYCFNSPRSGCYDDNDIYVSMHPGGSCVQLDISENSTESIVFYSCDGLNSSTSGGESDNSEVFKYYSNNSSGKTQGTLGGKNSTKFLWPSTECIPSSPPPTPVSQADLLPSPVFERKFEKRDISGVENHPSNCLPDFQLPKKKKPCVPPKPPNLLFNMRSCNCRDNKSKSEKQGGVSEIAEGSKYKISNGEIQDTLDGKNSQLYCSSPECTPSSPSRTFPTHTGPLHSSVFDQKVEKGDISEDEKHPVNSRSESQQPARNERRLHPKSPELFLRMASCNDRCNGFVSDKSEGEKQGGVPAQSEGFKYCYSNSNGDTEDLLGGKTPSRLYCSSPECTPPIPPRPPFMCVASLRSLVFDRGEETSVDSADGKDTENSQLEAEVSATAKPSLPSKPPNLYFKMTSCNETDKGFENDKSKDEKERMIRTM